MEYPVYFIDGKTCPYCWTRDLVSIDKFERESKVMLYPLLEFKCRNCGKEFFIRWIKDDNSGEYMPIAVSEEARLSMENEIVQFAKDNQRDLET